MKKVLFLSVLLFFSAAAYSQPFLRLSSLFGDGMVLQAESTVSLWGWTTPNGSVSIETSWGEKAVVKSDYSSMFVARVKTPAPTFEPQTITFSIKRGNDVLKKIVSGVLVGQVWLCTGQSNMAYSASTGTVDMRDEIDKGALNDNLRLFNVPRHGSDYPQEDVDASWTLCDAKNAEYFSAVGYFFGKQLQETLGQPIGLVNASWGGTPIELWMRSASVNDAARESWKTIPSSKRAGWRIGSGWNGMIAPLKNMTVAGVIWYQGCSNRSNGEMYAGNLSAMISDWRSQFAQDFPFYFVQIAPKQYPDNDLQGAVVREQQEMVSKSVSKTGMVAIPDCVDDITNIHPKYKRTVGTRLANMALTDVYKKDMGKVRHASFASAEVKKNRMIVSFSNVGGSLVCSGDGGIVGLEIGDGKSFYPAQGIIQGDKLIVWSSKVTKPVAVRYCFNQTIGNLFDEAGLPVLPFRSDAGKAVIADQTPKAKPAAPVQVAPARKGPAPRLESVPVDVASRNMVLKTLGTGVEYFLNRDYKLSEVCSSIDGWQFISYAGGSEEDHEITIWPKASGTIYVLARDHRIIAAALEGWQINKDAVCVYKTRDPQKPGILYVYSKAVKKGECIKVNVKDFAGAAVIAPSITQK